jgi:hypothetical protein
MSETSSSSNNNLIVKETLSNNNSSYRYETPPPKRLLSKPPKLIRSYHKDSPINKEINIAISQPLINFNIFQEYPNFHCDIPDFFKK